MPTPTGLLKNSPCALTRPGIFSRGKADLPQTNVKCRPTPSLGFSRANSTASSHPVSLTIKLAVVRMPSRCACTTASLMECERPKSSALTMSRRPESGVRSSEFGVEETGGMTRGLAQDSLRYSVVRGCRAEGEPQPGPENQQGFLYFIQAGGFRAEHIESLLLQFLQQPPIDRAHQLSGDHGVAVLDGQGLPCLAVKMFGAPGDFGGQLRKTVGVFVPQDFVGR